MFGNNYNFNAIKAPPYTPKDFNSYEVQQDLEEKLFNASKSIDIYFSNTDERKRNIEKFI